MRQLLIPVFLFIPNFVSAAVLINEVAWMGSESSANHEWIELHNTGGQVDVTGWKLTDGMNLEIELEGVIPANGYAVLERTSEVSSPANAFLIYTGALVNTGATLKLERSDGSIEDQVSGGENWQNIGGDNITKETAQYTSSGWVTAAATPGLTNKEFSNQKEVEVISEEKTVSKSSGSSGSASETVTLELPDVTLKLDVESQKVGYVNQQINFEVKPSGIGKNLINSLEYEWNFGDGETASIKDASHTYSFPGTYIVTVYGGFKRQEQVARHEITILPVVFSLTKNKSGDIQVNNDSPYEVDLSGYGLVGGKTFYLPDRTIILPNQTITIQKEKIAANDNLMIGLYDNAGVLIDSILPTGSVVTAAYFKDLESDFENPISYIDKPLPVVSSISDSRASSVSDNFSFVSVEPAGEFNQEDVINDESENSNLASAYSAGAKNNLDLTYIGLFIVMVIGVLGVYIRPKSN